jgi:ABC-type microcin C transport system permease subunit YejE
LGKVGGTIAFQNLAPGDAEEIDCWCKWRARGGVEEGRDVRNVFSDPVGWAEKAVGTTARFVFLCASTLVFWGLAMAGMHLAVRASALLETTGGTLPAFYQGVWVLLYVTTFAGFVAMPVMYLIALQGLLVAVRTKRKKHKG